MAPVGYGSPPRPSETGSVWGVESEGIPSLTLEWGQDPRVDFSKNEPFMFGRHASVSERPGPQCQANSCGILRVEARAGLRRGKLL